MRMGELGCLLPLSLLICEVGTGMRDLRVYSKDRRVNVCQALHLGHEGSTDGNHLWVRMSVISIIIQGAGPGLFVVWVRRGSGR